MDGPLTPVQIGYGRLDGTGIYGGCDLSNSVDVRRYLRGP